MAQTGVKVQAGLKDKAAEIWEREKNRYKLSDTAVLGIILVQLEEMRNNKVVFKMQ